MLNIETNQSPLHELHLRLCEWPASLIAAEMRTDARFAAWVANHLPPDLLEFVNASPRPEKLLSQDEFRELADIVADGPCVDNSLLKFVEHTNIPGYLDPRLCIAEIAHHLGTRAADEFALRCAGFASRLQGRRLALEDAIEVIADWADEVCDAKRAVDWKHRKSADLKGQAVGSYTSQQLADAETPLVESASSVLTPGEAASFLKTSSRHVRELIAQNILPAKNVGQGEQKPRYRIRREDLEAFLVAGKNLEEVTELNHRPRRRRLPENMVDHFAE